jgi:hypothetical protein
LRRRALFAKHEGRCKGSPRRRKTGGIRVELRGVDRPPIIMRSEVTWVVFILAGIAFVVAAVLIGAALAALPFIWGMVVAFAVVVLVAALVAVEQRRLWAAATIRAFVSATALDNGQRSPRKLLRAVIARLLERERKPRLGQIAASHSRLTRL